MEDPFVQQQEALLRRITNSAERLAEVVEEVNGELQHAEASYARIEKAHAVWKLYETKMQKPGAGGKPGVP
ncbi:DASH complex subunit dad4 [Hondaea fermentalgiana]|uniref:DASH complex subunit dad4 n=1 Tax=Hondaea fermentalgiana TaxID=2315210 RepID=A0A2R5GSX6_9STRA|nr:DASH complex subunit dad4 [Hondaea fermentalgiana]|eukprot:GBG33962.1 DASH complex subunit dad4 [Hondaea fermentalgiana]